MVRSIASPGINKVLCMICTWYNWALPNHSSTGEGDLTTMVQVTKLNHASTAEGYLTNVAQVSPALSAPELFVSEGLILSERKCIRAMLWLPHSPSGRLWNFNDHKENLIHYPYPPYLSWSSKLCIFLQYHAISTSPYNWFLPGECRSDVAK